VIAVSGRSASVARLTIQRMDHVGVMVDDLAAATAFFAFEVEDVDAVVARLRAHGAELVGEVERYEDI
jgi:predicted enzyme related to lactoylglutathione lyase